MTAAHARTVWGDILTFIEQHMNGVELNFNGTISLLRRRWSVLLGSVAVILAMGFLTVTMVPPQYTAVASLQINTRTEQVTKMQDVMGDFNTTDAAIRTEIDVLASRKLAARVIDTLKLEKNPDFMAGQSFFSQVKDIVGYALFPLQNTHTATIEDAPHPTEFNTKRRSQAINVFLSHLNVSMAPRSYTITIRYTARSPKLAAQIANTLSQQYLNSQLEDRFEATRRANEWINTRLKQMQHSVQSTERAVQKFREDNNLTAAKGVLLSEQQLSELNSQLIIARTQLAEAQAKASQAGRNRGGIESAAEVLNNPLIMHLREQETEVRRTMSDLGSRYGDKHPKIQTIRNQLGDLQRKIGEEIYKIRGSLDNEVAVAQARVDTLQEQLDNLQEKTSSTSDASVQLAELERQAQAEKTLYENFLSRSKELSQMDFAQTDARVISPAEEPLGASSPQKTKVLMLSTALGALLGVAIMLALEALDSGFRTSLQLENLTTTPVLGLLGELPHDIDRAHYVIEKPTGAFTEGVRGIRTAMQFANPDKESKVVMVTSTVPQEGKSLFAASLAQLTAHGGAKVLLVDADLRRPSLAKQLGLKPKAGLAEVLVDKAKLKDVLLKMPQSKLDVLPALANTHFAQELLNSQKMADLVAEWRQTYDLVVIDCPPVMAVSDAITVSRLVDAALFMVRWGTTPRTLVHNAIKQMQSCNVPLTGCVISRVDLEKQHAYGYGDYGYYYGKYKDYYND